MFNPSMIKYPSDKGNYRPISLLPISGKLVEKIVFDQVYYDIIFKLKCNGISGNLLKFLKISCLIGTSVWS